MQLALSLLKHKRNDDALLCCSYPKQIKEFMSKADDFFV